MAIARIIISALRGGSGKTIVSVGLAAVLRERGCVVVPFKKGPDYIDAGWLGLAAGQPCFNLDTFLVPPEEVITSFLTRVHPDGIALIEGNRGLYDSIDTQGTTSTAELAGLLACPVVLVLDCTKSTRTMAALVTGCRVFDPTVDLRGVILNRVAGKRHEANLRANIEKHCGVPVLGALPKLPENEFPERHMGLIPTAEHAWASRSVGLAAEAVNRYLDVDRLLEIAHAPYQDAPYGAARAGATTPPIPGGTEARSTPPSRPRVGVARDSAFQFYYPENLEALGKAGAEVVFFSLLHGGKVPAVDALYLGGGFPETHAPELAANREAALCIRDLVERGLPVYAECGGLMYLGNSLVLEGKSHPMAGILPVVFGFSTRPQGHGYTIAEVEGPNPYFETGTRLLGHEFHYSSVLEWGGSEDDLVFRMKRGKGFWKGRDGLCRKNVLATYTHIHALGTPGWASALVRRARAFKSGK